MTLCILLIAHCTTLIVNFLKQGLPTALIAIKTFVVVDLESPRTRKLGIRITNTFSSHNFFLPNRKTNFHFQLWITYTKT